jgi:hypothetical protein
MIKNILVFMFIFLSINLSYAQEFNPPTFEERFPEERVNDTFYLLGLNLEIYDRKEHELMYNSFIKTMGNYIKFMKNNKPEGLIGKKLLCSYNYGSFINDSGKREKTTEEHGFIFIPKSTVHGDIPYVEGNLAALAYSAQKPDVNVYKHPDAGGYLNNGFFFGVNVTPAAVRLSEKKIGIEFSGLSNGGALIDRETLSYTDIYFNPKNKITYGKCKLYDENMTKYFFTKQKDIMDRNIEHYQKKKAEQEKKNKI